jgi:hypothetical protein
MSPGVGFVWQYRGPGRSGGFAVHGSRVTERRARFLPARNATPQVPSLRRSELDVFYSYRQTVGYMHERPSTHHFTTLHSSSAHLCLGSLGSTVVEVDLSTALHAICWDLAVLVPTVMGTVELHGGDISSLLDTGCLFQPCP